MGTPGADPPTPLDRVELFVSLVDEYRELSAAFPYDYDHPLGVGTGDAEVTVRHRWPFLIRAMALRKFMLAPTGSVYVPTVLDALDACTQDEATHSEIEIHRRKVARNYWQPVYTSEGEVDYYEKTSPDLVINDQPLEGIVRDAIYGVFLHGDYDKWLRARKARSVVPFALWVWTEECERLLVGLRLDVDRWRGAGLIPPTS